ncbi:hypothetical protein B7463_g7727, partial [Scytalidium lignicola]
MADILIGKAVKGIAGGIGLASEGISHYKQQKAARKIAGQSKSPDTSPPYENFPDAEMQSEEKSKDVPSAENDDEEQWKLDDVQDEQSPAISSNNAPPAKTERDVHKITANFIARYPAPEYPSLTAAPKLPLPVLLPQRRPKDRARGFIRAYAPVLAECGIDQDLFLDFLDTFNQASQASPWINAINLAGFATMALPMGIGIAVQAAITIAVKAATEVHSRHRTNTFLDTINDEFFCPRGLYCLVMTWNPESDAKETSVNLATTISTSINEHDSSQSGMSKLKHNLKRSNGNTYGELDFPDTAPLIFPGLDKLQEQTSEEAKSKRDKLKKTKKFVSEYYDRRAQAEYAGQNPNSALANTPKPSFTSRYADPNHPANNGNLISLATGGYINPSSLGSGRGLGGLGSLGGGGLGGLRGYSRGDIRDARYAGAYDRNAIYNRGFPADRIPIVGGFLGGGPGRGLGPGRGGYPGDALQVLNPVVGVKKLLTRKVLYLMIVNIPSDDELAAAHQTVAEFQLANAGM